MMNQLLVASFLVALAFAGVASASGPCPSGTSPVGLYRVCLLQYEATSTHYDCTMATCGYEYHGVFGSTYNAPVDLSLRTPGLAGTIGVAAYQYKSDYAYDGSYQGNTFQGEGASKLTTVAVCGANECAYFHQDSFRYTYRNSFGGGDGSGRSTDAGTSLVSFHQVDYANNSDCCGSTSFQTTYIQAGPQQVALANVRDVPEVPDFPHPPL
ncbi:MAG: hypothetical protein LC624_00100 [Halobacteriales archaeon]|nr:hypothetical protein [Halobacteriales archaeon]